MMVRRDKDGVTHWAHPPTPHAFHQKIVSTGAKCDFNISTFGNLNNVPQDGPTCLWCIQGLKR